MVPSYVFEALRNARMTPGGLYIVGKRDARNPFMEARSTPMTTTPLPIDITHPHDYDNRAHPELDEAFLQKLADLPKVEGYTHLTPELIARHKQTLRRGKDRKDLELLKRHFPAA